MSMGSELLDALEQNFRSFQSGGNYQNILLTFSLPDRKDPLEILIAPHALAVANMRAEALDGEETAILQPNIAFYEDADPDFAVHPEDFFRVTLFKNKDGKRVLEGLLIYDESVYELSFAENVSKRPKSHFATKVDTSVFSGSDTCGTPHFQDETGLADVSEDFPKGTRANIALVGDSKLFDAMGGDPVLTAEYILSRFYFAAGFFSKQFRLRLQVSSVTIATRADTISKATAPGDVLRDFSRWGQQHFGNANIALSHLYTGQNLDGTVVGIAWVNVVCGNWRYALSENRNTSLFWLAAVTAHELGHNFAMSHDSGCSSDRETKYLMCPYVPQFSPRFSETSLTSGVAAIDRAYRSGCVSPVY